MEVILRPDLGRKPYRLKCRFRMGAHPSHDQVLRAAAQTMDTFVRDMHAQGLEYIGRVKPQLFGPFPAVSAKTLRVPAQPTARQMLRAVSQGARFLAEPLDGLQDVLPLGETEKWEYEIRGVFSRDTILTEIGS